MTFEAGIQLKHLSRAGGKMQLGRSGLP